MNRTSEERYFGLFEEIHDFSEFVGLPEWFWDDVFYLEEFWGFELWTYYVWREDDDTREDDDASKYEPFEFDLLPASFDFRPFFEPNEGEKSVIWTDDVKTEQLLGMIQEFEEELNELQQTTEGINEPRISMVTSGARIGSFSCIPFSRFWYVCRAFEQLMQCVRGDSERRARSCYQLGKFISEAQWKDRTENQLIVASSIASMRKNAGQGGARASRDRRQANLETLMQEIEKLADVVGKIGEDLIVSQAFENARTSQPKMPGTKRTLDDYGTTLRSEEPFKSRYEAVFRKNA